MSSLVQRGLLLGRVGQQQLARLGLYRNRCRPVSIVVRPASSAGHGHHGHDHGHVRTDKEVSEWVKKELDKGWVSFGWNPYDRKVDTELFHVTMFVVVGMILFPAFIFYYMPDPKFMDWTHREAFLRLRECEEKGVFPISPDLIDPNKIDLPSDEELGDTELVI